MIRRISALLMAAAWPALAQEPAKPSPLTTELTDTTWTVRAGDQPLLVYNLSASPKKPYVKELAPPGGGNILRDAPADHLHHHGLMYAITANGVNFWEESPAGGVQKPSGTPAAEIIDGPDGTQRALFRQRLLWVKPEDAGSLDSARSALLVEDRSLLVGVAEGGRTTVLRWLARFTVNAPEVTLTGSNYHGLGMRFRADLDPAARAAFPETGPVALEGAAQLVQPSLAGAVVFESPAAALATTIAAAPGNAGTSAFFTMKQPFAYLSATQCLDKAPLQYRQGESYELGYTVTVTRDPQTVKDLEARPAKP